VVQQPIGHRARLGRHELRQVAHRLGGLADRVFGAAAIAVEQLAHLAQGLDHALAKLDLERGKALVHLLAQAGEHRRDRAGELSDRRVAVHRRGPLAEA
jgi:hypothetical protein